MIEGPDFSEAGAVATREMWYYANDMPAVIQRTKAGNTVTTGFDYDGLGKRIKKSVWGGGDTYYLGDYYEIENGNPVMYVYAGGLRVAKVAGATKNYYHKDHLQSSSVMTNATGLSVETTQYMPFGHTRTPPGPSISNYKFTDQERDPETNLYNYDARHYDPVIGRFISADSVVQDFYDPQALNRYAYARNNPLKYVDPDGHVAVPAPLLAYLAVLLASPDTPRDLQMLALDVSKGDWVAAAGDTAGLAIPGLTGGGAIAKGLERAGERAILSTRAALMKLRSLGLVQRHHVVHQQFFKEGTETARFLQEIGFSKEGSLNKLFLPIIKGLLGDRAKHWGGHTDEAVDKVRGLLGDTMRQHRAGNISSEQARKLLEEEAKKLRQGLKTGEEKLQKD